MSQWSYHNGDCGGMLRSPSGILSSPSYPDKYPSNAECVYTISQPNDTYISLTFLMFDVWPGQPCENEDYLEVRDGSSEKSPLIGLFCGTMIPILSIQSTKNVVWLR